MNKIFHELENVTLVENPMKISNQGQKWAWKMRDADGLGCVDKYSIKLVNNL